MVGRVVTHYRFALVRDLLALGYRATDMFSPRLSFYELTCIIVAAPPNSSVRYYLDGGWSREAQILANWQEQQSGLTHMTSPYDRPGQVAFTDGPTPENPFGGNIFQADEMSLEEMDRRLAARYAAATRAEPDGARKL